MPRGKPKRKINPESNPVGAPTKQSPKLLALIIEKAGEGIPPKIISQIARINESTLYRWLEDDKDFAAEFYFARATKIVELHKRIEKDDPKFIAKNLEPHCYRDRIQQEITGQGGEPIKMVVVDYRAEPMTIQEVTSGEEKEETKA